MFLLVLSQQISAQTSPKPVSPDGLTRPEEIYRAPSIRERQFKMMEMEREAAKPRTPEEARLALAELAEDFRQIQLINNKMMSETMSAPAPNYHKIAETTGEIRKLALRIRKNLHLPEAQKATATKDPERKPIEDAPQMKAALLDLDKSIMSFTQNPMFVKVEVVDVEQGAKARRDLEKIIDRSQMIRKDAEKLKKTTPKNP
jgi:hypothetical protein